MRKLCCALALCGLLAGAVPAADWEWTQDKGWTQGAGQARENADAQLKYAWELEQDKRFQNAARQYFLLLKTWPDSEEAGIGLQRLANCLFKMENYYDSFKALEQVIKSYPTSIKKNDLLKIEFLIGRKFQTGARRDMVDMNEPAAKGLETAVEIFQAVIANDSVGPYAGAAHLAIADCYRKMGDDRQAVTWYDRVLEQFSYSNELVAKAEMGKQLSKVAIGEESVENANVKRDQLKQMLKDTEKEAATAQGSVDPEPVTDLKEEFSELNEKEAEKLWKSAEYYRKRGSYDSLHAYKFTLEQLVIRYPNTRYASEARKKIGTVKVPEKEPHKFGKINIPFVKKEQPPTFIAAANNPDHVAVDRIPVPGTGDDEMPPENANAASAVPLTPFTDRPSPTPVAQIPAAPTVSAAPQTAPTTPTSGLQTYDAQAEREHSAAPVATAPAPAAPVIAETTPLPREINPEGTTAARAPTPAPGGSSAIPAGLRERMSNASAYRTPEEIERARAASAANEKAAQNSQWGFSSDFE